MRAIPVHLLVAESSSSLSSSLTTPHPVTSPSSAWPPPTRTVGAVLATAHSYLKDLRQQMRDGFPEQLDGFVFVLLERGMKIVIGASNKQQLTLCGTYNRSASRHE